MYSDKFLSGLEIFYCYISKKNNNRFKQLYIIIYNDKQ